MLTAAPGGTSALGAWSVPGCGPGPTCTVTATETPTTATVTFAAAASGVLRVELAGDAPGEVTVDDLDHSGTEAWCKESCSVPLEPGARVFLYPATPFDFGGWDPLCEDTSPTRQVCLFTMPASATATVTVTFRRNAADQWVWLLREPPAADSHRRALSVDFDGAGNLVVGTTEGLYKLSPTGDEIWSRSTVPGPARVDPIGDIFVLWRGELTKVSRNGALLWARDLGEGDDCWLMGSWDYLAHRFATAPNGDVAILRGSSQPETTLRVLSGDGTERWSVSVPDSRCAVAVSPAGAIYTIVENPYDRETPNVRRFAGDGTLLGDAEGLTDDLEGIFDEYYAAIGFGPDGAMVTSSSGFDHVYAARHAPKGTQTFRIARDSPPNHVISNAVAGDASGFTIWMYAVDDGPTYDGVVASWITPTGDVVWALRRPSFDGGWYSNYGGAWPVDVAVRDGVFAIVGQYGSTSMFAGNAWVQTFRPPSTLSPAPAR